MKIQFESYSLDIKKNKANKPMVYDIIRKKWILLSPEEQVRQIWIHYLVYSKHFSPAKIAVEKMLLFNNKRKRFDICVYGPTSLPQILIECKAPSIPLSIPVFEQLALYNAILCANTFIITNGISHLGYKITADKIEPIMDLTIPMI